MSRRINMPPGTNGVACMGYRRPWRTEILPPQKSWDAWCSLLS